uniref:PID domain-containing protein n=1 Tax=Xiphophorus couchianus TaxID=32473 RepID=A0A3B5L5U7_9TELE
MSKKSKLDDLQPRGDDWNPGGGGGLVSKPSRGWLHSNEKISGPGVTYVVKYLGCIEVLRSMRSLDFTTRSQITRYVQTWCGFLHSNSWILWLVAFNITQFFHLKMVASIRLLSFIIIKT